jgi:hypothetical protein
LKIFNVFQAYDTGNLGIPVAIKKLLPDWYKKSEDSFVASNGESRSGLKKCIPFFDAMLSGYALVTPADIYVSKNEDGLLVLSWDSDQEFSDFIVERPAELGKKIPRPAGHFDNHLVFKGYWGINTPKGWSVLITQPLNRFDLPFTITSGIVDSDEFSSAGNVPFFIREDFSGTIPAGTPFAQLIPIKRSSWKIVNNLGKQYMQRLHGQTVREDGNSYKKLMWHRKTYN